MAAKSQLAAVALPKRPKPVVIALSAHLRLWSCSCEGCCAWWSNCSGCVRRWRGELLPCSGQLALRIGEFLAGRLKPPLQLCHLSVAGGQVIRCLRQLGLKISPLLGRLVLDFSLLPGQALPLRAEVGQLCLSGRLYLTRLLEALLRLGEL